MYSGGNPRSGALDAVAVAALWSHVRALEANTACHVEDRAKGTGAFHLVEGTERRSFIVARGPELRAFDSLVAAW